MTRRHHRPAAKAPAARRQAQALAHLQKQAAAAIPQPYDWAKDPIWDEPIPEPPDWDTLDDHAQEVYRLAVVAYAVRAIADKRGVTAARQLADWEVL